MTLDPTLYKHVLDDINFMETQMMHTPAHKLGHAFEGKTAEQIDAMTSSPTDYYRKHPNSPVTKVPHNSAESDPLGIPQHSPGAKLDAGKQLPFTVLGAFSPALSEIVRVGSYGASKYTKHGWISVPNGKERYYEAALRHLLEDMKSAESKDADTDITHLAHAVWNLLAVITLRLSSKSV